MRFFYYLSSCDSCKRIRNELSLDESIIQIDIKKSPITNFRLEQIHAIAGSYEALFSKRAQLYKQRNLKRPLSTYFRRLRTRSKSTFVPGVPAVRWCSTLTATLLDGAAHSSNKASATLTCSFSANPGAGAISSCFVFAHSSRSSRGAHFQAKLWSQFPEDSWRPHGGGFMSRAFCCMIKQAFAPNDNEWYLAI